jgi:ligand-binding sensor domain-containing protein/signal transduction histidine kinase
MTQTRDGYLWLGTLGGLVRFDGIEFTIFDENNTPGLESSRIVYLFEDSQGNLWIGTETAGVFLAKKNQPVVGLEIGRGSAEGRLVAAAQDSSGAVWLYTASGQLYRYHNGTLDAFSEDRLTPYSSHRSLVPGESGELLVSTDQQVWAIPPVAEKSQKLPLKRVNAFGKLDWLMASPRGGFWYLHDLKIEKWGANSRERELGEYPWNWSEARVSAACEDADGNLIVGTLGAGVFWFDSQGKATPLSTEQGLSSDFILALHMDSEGALWVATDGGGLNRVIRQVFDVLPPSRGKSVQSVSPDGEGGMWLGYAGLFGGVDHWTKSEVVQYGVEYKLPVRAVLVDRKERVWAGTSGSRVGAGLFQLNQADRFEKIIPKSVESLEVAALFEDSKGRLWMGTGLGLYVLDGDWREYTTRDGLSSDDVRAIAEDKEGSIWIGTRGGGLNRLRDGKFMVFRKADGLPSDKITSIYVDDRGVLWIGTDGGGLARFHEGKWTQYSTREGLASNSVGYLLEDGQGYLWMGSYAALMRAAKKDLEEFARGAITMVPLRIYGQADGLPSGECTSGSQPAACRTPDGTLWFPTIKGLAYVPVEQLRPNTNPPPVVIESVLFEGQPQRTNYLRRSLRENVTIPPSIERLEIHYTSLNLRAAERARFRYRLEGHETTWTEAGNTRVARYSKLPPGDYRFQVTACNEDGVWSPVGGSLAMIVQPPFWRTWWFLTGTTIALLAGIVATVHYFSVQKLERQLAAARQREAVEKERARIARDVHDQLGANLTQLALLGEMVQDDKELPTEVEAHARQICQAARDTTRSLDEIVWTVNPANDTLEGLVNYICKYAQDYLEVAGLRARLELPAQVPGAMIAPEVRHNVFLAAKESLTNVVRHAKASAVWLRLDVQPGRVTLEIADDGKGLAGMDEKRAATRHGLRNMEQRMRDIGGGFEMSAATEGGVRVKLTVPIQIRN